jgi:CheY-like chemotaxis protein
MPTWALWTTLAILIWTAMTGLVIVAIGRASRVFRREDSLANPTVDAAPSEDALVFPPVGKRQPSPLAASQAKAEGKESGPTLPTRILVVDDDPGLRALLRTSFEVAHLDVDEADGARSAAKAIANRRPDVIILDVAMPGIDGISFCRGLKADPFTSAIPVVLLTGDSISDSAGQAAGADAFLRKPFSPLALLNAIEGLAVRTHSQSSPRQRERSSDQQLLLYAQDSAAYSNSSAASACCSSRPTEKPRSRSPARSNPKTATPQPTANASAATPPSSPPPPTPTYSEKPASNTASSSTTSARSASLMPCWSNPAS